jgi:hypothetical protein
MEIDLNLDNYNLQDLLSLFKLDYNFTEDDLKRAKKVALMTHPDKSNLDKKYFLFFTNAYKVIYSIHQFRTRSNSQQSTEYFIEKEENEDKGQLLREIAKKKNFNKIFNKLFEQNRIRDEAEETGYGDWLKSNEDLDTRSTTRAEMNETFEKKKSEVRSLVVHKDIEEMISSSAASDIISERPESYGSSMFSSLQYEDLRKAHVECVVPVTMRDYEERKKFKNVDEFVRYRDDSVHMTPLSTEQSTEYLKQKQSMIDKTDVNRAFKLAKQAEEVRKANQSWMSGIQLLTIRGDTTGRPR